MLGIYNEMIRTKKLGIHDRVTHAQKIFLMENIF